MRAMFAALAAIAMAVTAVLSDPPLTGLVRTHRQLHISGDLVGEWVIIRSPPDRPIYLQLQLMYN